MFMERERINIYLTDILIDLLAKNNTFVEINLKPLQNYRIFLTAKKQPTLYVYQDGCRAKPIHAQLNELLKVGKGGSQMMCY